MQLSNLPKTLLIIAICAFLYQGCGSVNTGNNVTGPAADAPKTEPPFNSAEPETYQTEITVTSAGVTEKFFAVRKGTQWRIDTAYGDPKQVTTLRTDRDYILSSGSKMYADFNTGHGFDERVRMIDEITRGMLNGSKKAVYEKIGSEGGVTKYRMWGEAGKDLESVFSFDEKAGVPVKLEIFKNGSRAGAPDVTVQLIGFKLEADEALLAIPKDFKKVPLEVMKRILVAAP